MKKILIPAILAATILIVGVFALVPVEKAATVHTTIQNSQQAIQVQSITGTLVNTSNDEIQVACGNPAATNKNRDFRVYWLSMSVTTDAGLDLITIDDVVIDTITLTDVDAATFADVVVGGATGTQTPAIVPTNIASLTSQGEIDFDYTGNAIADDALTGTVILVTTSDAVCTYVAQTRD